MPTDIVIPALGESITEGVIATWLIAEGEYVDRDQPVLELETDKITMELPAPAAGVVSHKAAEGDTVEVGSVVGGIDESAAKPAGEAKADSKKSEPKKTEPAAAAAAKAESKPTEGASGPATAAASGKAPPADPAKQQLPSRANRGPVGTPAPVLNMPGGPAPAGPISDDDVAATPLARKIAHERGVDMHAVAATGPGGRVREQDVLAFIQTHQNGDAGSRPASSGSAPSPASRIATREKMSPLRQRIAARLVEAQHTAAMLTTFNECDMTGVMALRSKHKEAFAERHGVGLGFMSFFVKASVSALQKFELVNAFIVDGEKGPEVEKHSYCDIAVAVGTPKGLVVPVLRDCGSRSFAGVESGIKELAIKARDGKLALEDMQGGTFTISNGGVYGSMMSTPILNPPQSAILGMHNIIRRPVENPDKPGSGEVVVRPMMYLALSYDHRIVDGAEAVGFLKHIKECIEDPARLLFDM